MLGSEAPWAAMGCLQYVGSTQLLLDPEPQPRGLTTLACRICSQLQPRCTTSTTSRQSTITRRRRSKRLRTGPHDQQARCDLLAHPPHPGFLPAIANPTWTLDLQAGHLQPGYPAQQHNPAVIQSTTSANRPSRRKARGD